MFNNNITQTRKRIYFEKNDIDNLAISMPDANSDLDF